MKKSLSLTSMLLIVVICFCISSCDTATTTGSDETTKSAEVTVTDRNTSSDSEAESDSGTETTDDNTTLEPVIPEVLPVYIDGTVKLADRNIKEMAPPNRQKRFCYYGWINSVNPYVDMNIDNSTLDKWAKKYYGNTLYSFSYKHTQEPSEMAFVSYIKEFNIPRDVMEEALAELAEEFDSFIKIDPNREIAELPNLDIIYTLDNKIIDEYYRYA